LEEEQDKLEAWRKSMRIYRILEEQEKIKTERIGGRA
jgi:hypothetical protein